MSIKILGIESSCDETAAAVVEDGHRVLSSVVASQTKVHAVFGGVVPEIASREHLRVIASVVDKALADAGITTKDLAAIAVTRGPGLIGALLVGVSYAKGLALATGLPLVPVDHVHAHVHGALLGLDDVAHAGLYPTLALVVSGGHTNLYRMDGPTRLVLLASTIDDACGESFDKVGKLLGLPYPGGPAVERVARTGDPTRVPMPRMVEEKSRLEFSYSGLKTHVAQLIRAGLSEQERADLCAGFQEEALGQIARKLERALAEHGDVKSVLVAGGVAANQRFRAMLADKLPVPCHFPDLRYCSDNGAMIAAYGHHLYVEGEVPAFRDLSWDAYSRYDFAGWTS